MGSPLKPVIAGIFMVELERSLLSMLSSYITSWTRYGNDTIVYVTVDAVEHVLCIPNSFYGKLINIKISLLDILILRNVPVLRTLYNVNSPIKILLSLEVISTKYMKTIHP